MWVRGVVERGSEDRRRKERGVDGERVGRVEGCGKRTWEREAGHR